MLQGKVVGLRARTSEDIAELHDGLMDDPVTRSRSSAAAWVPVSLVCEPSPFAAADTEAVARFSVVELSGSRLAGAATMWGIDLHNRMAHLGLTLLPHARGRSLGTDVVEVLCHYGFVLRGLHRLQVDTLADNPAMIRAAQSSGFVEEGRLRRSAWVTGEFVDEVILGLLAEEWFNRGR